MEYRLQLAPVPNQMIPVWIKVRYTIAIIIFATVISLTVSLKEIGLLMGHSMIRLEVGSHDDCKLPS